MKHKLFVLGLSVLASSAFAQTKTVGATGADFTTINAALAFFQPTDPDGSTANVINIIDGGVYDEAIVVQTPITIAGTGSSRPRICCQQTASPAEGTDGFTVVLTTAGTVNLTNLILLPSRTVTPADDILRALGTQVTTMNLTDILITANNGSDSPVSVDGLTEVDLTGATRVGDDGAHLTAAAGSTYTLNNVVVTHCQNGGNNDGIVMSSGFNYHINDGCVFSFNQRLGLQAAGADFTINAPTNRCLVLGNKGFAGIWFSAPQTVARSINGCNLLNNTSFGIENQNRGVTGTNPDASFSNMIIAGNSEGFVHSAAAATTGIATTNATLTNVTIANNSLQPLDFGATGEGTLTVSDSIIAGNGSANATNVIAQNGTGAMTITDSAIVTSGPFALTTPATTGTGTVNQTRVINADPEFVETATFGSADFFDVDSDSYFEAGTATANLGGGADWVGDPPPPTAAAKNWTLFQ